MRIALLSLVALMMVSLLGCVSSDRNDILANLTPELYGLHERPSDVARNWAVTDNANLRMIADDLGRMWMTNQPSHLSPFPIMTYSGNPF